MTSSAMNHTGFRSDIQGLRAIAVLAVVIFHIVPHLLTGGYLGVDVFFVVSGYVVTLRLKRQWQQGQLNLTEFYRSRFIRLAPALLMMLTVTSLLSLWLLLPSELETFAAQLTGVLTLCVNFILMFNSGYFSPAAETMPLLHTWSLAVEEHFYLLLPLLFLFIPAGRVAVVRSWMIGLCLCSFIAGILLQQWNSDLSFYLSPLRFYQFLLGCLAASWIVSAGRTHWAAEILNIMAMFVLLACFSWYDKTTPPLGFSSLLPTLATAVLLSTLPLTRYCRLLLSAPPLRFIGDISYSTYLWHWPLIVFFKMAVSVQIDLISAGGLLLGSILAGWISYSAIEQPWRGRGKLATLRLYRKPVAANLTLAASLLVTGGVLIHLDGMPRRLSAQQQADAQWLNPTNSHYRQGSCFLTSASADVAQYDQATCLKAKPDKPKILLLGDSHAAHLYEGLQQVTAELQWLQANASGCKPLQPLQGRPVCVALYSQIIWPQLASNAPTAIVLSANWHQRDIPAIRETVIALSRFAKVYVIGPSVQYQQALPRMLINYRPDADWQNLSTQRETRQLDLAIRAGLQDTAGHYLSLYQQQCPASRCYLRASNGTPLIWDHNHFTLDGSQMLSTALVEEIRSTL